MPRASIHLVLVKSSELIRKENLKDTQLVTRSEFQRISIFLTQIPEILARQVLYLSLQISSQT
ncbi:hypothetical protein NSTC731_02937 [Nostoc sp. DSM 114167]|jgi:hypothetical protein